MWWWTRGIGGDSQFDSADSIICRVERQPKGEPSHSSIMVLTCPRTIFHDSNRQLTQGECFSFRGRDEVDRHLRDLARYIGTFCFDVCHIELFESKLRAFCFLNFKGNKACRSSSNSIRGWPAQPKWRCQHHLRTPHSNQPPRAPT